MGAELPYQICEIGSICRMWRNTQNTHLPCSPISIHIFLAEGDVSNNSIYVVLSISIHTFLVEGDDVQYQITELTKISIHTFLTEGDHMRGDMARIMPFQSTPSLRKVTISVSPRQVTVLFQSTPSLRKVTPFFHRDLTSIYISIHTFLAEGDNNSS